MKDVLALAMVALLTVSACPAAVSSPPPCAVPLPPAVPYTKGGTPFPYWMNPQVGCTIEALDEHGNVTAWTCPIPVRERHS